MQISLQSWLLLGPSIMFKTTCAKYSKEVATRPLPVYFSRACILHSSHALQNILYTAWTLLTFHILLLIYIDLCTCKLLETLQLKNKRETKIPSSMPKSNGFQSEVRMFQVLRQDHLLVCGKKILEFFFILSYFNVFLWRLYNYNKSTRIWFINTLVVYRIFFTDRICYLSMESTDIKNGLDTLYLYYYNTICQVIKRSTSKLSLTSKGLLKYWP